MAGSLAAVSLSISWVSSAEANPGGGKIVTGTGSITQSGTTTDVHQASQTLSLTWRTFDVASHDTVNFLQPSASAIAVNRIFDVNGSQILGHLNANGQVFLINPNGVLFGNGAVVNVGGLVASTLDLDDASLTGSARTFSGATTATVANRGTITATTGGYVALLGNKVSNQGAVIARLGTVALGAGSTMTLTFSDRSLLSFTVDRSVLKTVADNGGLLRADGGRVLMTAGARDTLLASVVNNSGVVEARTAEAHDGTIELLGSDTSGTVRVGGTLDASGTAGADHGGRIETSAARVSVSDDSHVTTAGAAGLFGSWLVDPNDFTVAASGGDISGTALSAQLATTSVTLVSSHGAKAGTGDVNINDAISWSANTGLTLTASNDVNVNRSLSATGASARLAINPNTSNGTEPASGTGAFNLAPGAAINLPNVSATSATALIIGGTPYIVLNRLGAAGSTTGADLQGINGNSGGHFALGSNIDASATATWNPLATDPAVHTGFTPITGLTGTLEGLGHTISKLYVNQTSTAAVGTGLLGSMSFGARVQNLGLIDVDIHGASGVGGLAGNNSGGTIYNAYVTGRVAGTDDVGGLVGYDSFGFIAGSHADVSVKGSASDVGGLVGQGYGSALRSSYATGDVTGPSRAGGLVGFIFGTIDQSYATGHVSGTSSVGGLVGWLDGRYEGRYGTITNSHATGLVTGTSDVGGLVGSIRGRVGGTIDQSYATGNVYGSSNVGGLVGFNGDNSDASEAVLGVVSNSYATGQVEGDRNVGGLIGFNVGSIADSYATGNVRGGSQVGGLAGSNGGENSLSGFGLNGVITNSYASGTVTGNADVGGLVGFSGLSGGGSESGPIGAVIGSHATGAVRGSSTTVCAAARTAAS